MAGYANRFINGRQMTEPKVTIFGMHTQQQSEIVHTKFHVNPSDRSRLTAAQPQASFLKTQEKEFAAAITSCYCSHDSQPNINLKILDWS